MGNGTVLIMFYSNDTCGNVGYYEIEVRKDILGPNLVITYPTENPVDREIHENNFEYTVDESADTVWYSINGGPNHIVTGNGDFYQTEWETAWNATAEGNYFDIIFYANDTHGNISQVGLRIYPVTNVEPDPNPKIPFGYAFLLFGLVAAATIGIFVNRKITKK